MINKPEQAFRDASQLQGQPKSLELLVRRRYDRVERSMVVDSPFRRSTRPCLDLRNAPAKDTGFDELRKTPIVELDETLRIVDLHTTRCRRHAGRPG